MLILIAKLSKRARMNTEDVLQRLYDDEDNEFEVDDPDKPFVDGSDEEFSDLDGKGR